MIEGSWVHPCRPSEQHPRHLRAILSIQITSLFPLAFYRLFNDSHDLGYPVESVNYADDFGGVLHTPALSGSQAGIRQETP